MKAFTFNRHVAALLLGSRAGVHGTRASEDRGGVEATAREASHGIQGVCAVVSGADEGHNAGAVPFAQPSADDLRQAACGPRHECALGQLGHRSVLDGADIGHGIRADHGAPSATTTAEAIAASCESETCSWATPRRVISS